ncbi:hypothetical protein CLOM_g6534 [Closterium sp. NIES-68]|nr:hypothetical protein CLOM_g6534 [Closterium sp. NIES-68]GJP75670.1 hypothetical protein CLOP_g6092 [Closterium sp. NIES-67]
MAPGETNRDAADASLSNHVDAAESRSSISTRNVEEDSIGEGLRLRKLRLGRDDQKRQTLHVPKPHVRLTHSSLSSSLEASSEPVSPVGRLFLDDSFYTTILCVLEFKNQMEIKELRDIMEHTLLQHPRFHSRLASSSGGVPGWVLMDAADVDLEYHVVEEEDADVDSLCHVAEGEGEALLGRNGEREGTGKGGEGEGGGEREGGGGGEEGGGEGEGALEAHVVRLQSLPPFDPNRPLWQVHLIHLPAGSRPSEPRQRHSAAVFRIHHALGDGISLMSLLLAATRQTDHPNLLPSLPGSLGASARQKASPSSEPAASQQTPSYNPAAATSFTSSGKGSSSGADGNISAGSGKGSGNGASSGGNISRCSKRESAPNGVPRGEALCGSFLKLLWLALVRAVLAIWQAVRVAVNTAAQIFEFLAVLACVADTPTPIKGGPHLHSHTLPLCFAVSPEMSLEEVSTIRRAVKGATVNDVMLTVISGGIERYLALVSPQTGGITLPRRLRVSALALVNLRPAPGLQELKELMAGQRSQARWGNHLGNVLLPLPVYSRAQGEEGTGYRREEVERLQAVQALCASRKDSLMAHWTYLNGRALMPLVGCKAVAALTRRGLDQTTLSLSNVVGPLEEVALHGHPIAAIIPSVYGSNHALTCHIQTYKGSARIVVSAVKQHVPNPHLLCRCFVEAFHQLTKEAKKLI